MGTRVQEMKEEEKTLVWRGEINGNKGTVFRKTEDGV